MKRLILRYVYLQHNLQIINVVRFSRIFLLDLFFVQILIIYFDLFKKSVPRILHFS